MTPNENLIIRQAIKADRSAIKDLWFKVIKSAFNQEHFDDDLTPQKELAFKMRQLDKAFESPFFTCFLAFEKQTLIGTIAYDKPPNQGILKQTNDALIDMMELGSLYIDPDKQKQGYGRALLKYALESLQKNGIEEICFDSIYEVSQKIWRAMFGEPIIHKKAPNHSFHHMIWVITVKEALSRI